MTRYTQNGPLTLGQGSSRGRGGNRAAAGRARRTACWYMTSGFSLYGHATSHSGSCRSHIRQWPGGSCPIPEMSTTGQALVVNARALSTNLGYAPQHETSVRPSRTPEVVLRPRGVGGVPTQSGPGQPIRVEARHGTDRTAVRPFPRRNRWPRPSNRGDDPRLRLVAEHLGHGLGTVGHPPPKSSAGRRYPESSLDRRPAAVAPGVSAGCTWRFLVIAVTR